MKLLKNLHPKTQFPTPKPQFKPISAQFPPPPLLTYLHPTLPDLEQKAQNLHHRGQTRGVVPFLCQKKKKKKKKEKKKEKKEKAVHVPSPRAELCPPRQLLTFAIPAQHHITMRASPAQTNCFFRCF